ncbi:MAG: bifunctional glutamate N-acetyltransferase/amino-acid acetyltransferase ArgJ [Actinobacteria bacterium]|nr:bifunctional glutamate N-acetyltransferase/amino-acid acetyltransferase ArgJ [Actinomycetota bacterium]
MSGFGPRDRAALTRTEGGVTAPSGFRAGGVLAGLKRSGRPDLALVVSDVPAIAAVAVTTNRVRAAPCVITARNAADGHARALVVNSGNANACTGPDGLAAAEATTEAVATHLGIDPTDVLICSTGVIGVPLDLARLLAAIPRVVADLSDDGGGRAARAILTTDTTTKEVAYRVEDATGACTVGGMAKGAGMIEPAMATLIGLITTDAPLTPAVLRPIVRQVVARTFNRISIDACGSTNDTVAVLANGNATQPPTLATFRAALESVCADLARAVVADGEGTNKVAELHVVGARSEDDAVALARAVAASTLFRAALAGADPNWGRVLAAMGATDVDFDPERVTVRFAGVTVCRYGVATAFDRGQAAAALSKRDVEVTVDLGLGAAEATFLTADLTPAYVRFNAEYTT